MQCFRVGYRGICHASHTHEPLGVCVYVYGKYKWQVACSTVSHEKALHIKLLYPMPIKNDGKFWKCSKISGNFRKLWKRFKPVFKELKRFMKILENLWQSSENFWKRSKMVLNFWENLRELVYGNFRKTSETVQKCFSDLSWSFKFTENLRKSSEVFGIFREFSENFRNGSKNFFFRCFYYFLKFSENLRKSSEVFENHRKTSGCDRKCSKCLVGVENFQSQFLRSPQMDLSKLLHASNDRKVEWDTTHCILSIAYRRICNGNPGLWLAVFSRHGIKHFTSVVFVDTEQFA